MIPLLSSRMLEILYQDEYLVAINKPPGLAVHRSKLIGNTDQFALQQLRDQIGQHVFPCHRLDRKTSGVLLFALDKKILAQLMSNFEDGLVDKKYLAIVRGWTIDSETIDYPLIDESGKSKIALTEYKTLDQVELDVPFGRFQTSRYSLVEASPKTGRMHQLRKHFAHIFHPIIGDRPHGCNKQNKLFLEKWNLKEMMLHAKELKIEHPMNGGRLLLQADLHSEFKRMISVLGFVK